MPNMLAKLRLGIVALVALLLLSGCVAINTVVTFLEGQTWKAVVDVTINAQLVSTIGEAQLESQMQSERLKIEQQEQQGVKHSMKKTRNDDGSVTYTWNMEGDTWSSLNRSVFSDRAVIEDGGQGRIHFTYQPDFGLIPGSTHDLTLIGGQIVSSNADEEKSGAAHWYNLTGKAEAVITPKSRFQICPLGAALILAAGLVAAGGSRWRKQILERS